MKRSELRRGKGLERRGQLERRTRLQPGKRKRRWSAPPAIRKAVLARSRGRCVACCVRAGLDPYRLPARLRRGLTRRAVHLHHLLPRERFPALEREPDNLVGVCAECHDEHERAHARIPAEAVPGCAFALAAASGAAEVDYLAKTYPAWRAAPGGSGPVE